MPNGNPVPGPLNSRYFRPVRGKETRARRWDLQFESTSLQRRVACEPDFLLGGAPGERADMSRSDSHERTMRWRRAERYRKDSTRCW